MGNLLFDLNNMQLDRSGDGFKNYFAFAYQYNHGDFSWFTGMQYPYGDLLSYADGQPALLILFKFLKSIGIKNVDFGSNVTIIEPVNLYGCSIGDNSFVGPFVEIQKNTIIGKNTKIQSHSFICELASIGDECFIDHVDIGTGAVLIKNIFESGVYAGNPAKKIKEING